MGLLIPALTPRDDGLLQGRDLYPFSFMAPRLQGTLHPSGRLDLALWGAGDLARVHLAPWHGPFVYGANILTAANGGLYAAQSQAAVLLAGTRVRRVSLARKPARWAAVAKGRKVRQFYVLDWGWMCVEERGPDTVIAAGASQAECESALSLSADQIRAEAQAHQSACDHMPDADPLMRSMVLFGMHTALASRRRLSDGRFAGLAAGMNYSAPARTYYRDGHWTLQALLTADPASVAAQIDLLATAIHDDGEAPSAVIVADAAQNAAWEAYRLAHPHEQADHHCATDWWSDHTDSPLFFILTLADYTRATGDDSLYRRHIGKVRAIVARYDALAAAHGGLPGKPRHDRDWADNVYREGHVSYIIGLWLQALATVALHAAGIDDALAQSAAAARQAAQPLLEPALRTADGWPCNYRAKEGTHEDNLSLDMLTLLLAGALPPPRAREILGQAQQKLETRHNNRQPWGDWGIMCAWPPYGTARDLRSKTSFAYRYHNGADWPYLDGIYARCLLEYDMEGFAYPLLRWWQYGLQQGWTSPVEYYSPPYPRGSLLQGWSSLPAAVALAHREKTRGLTLP